MKNRSFAIGLLLLGSGLSALLYQTAWQRQFQLVFGASTAASAAVLGIFLGGLGVGGLVLASRAERASRPLLFYANLEIAIAVLAALSPFALDTAGALYRAAGGSPALGTGGATVLRLFIATVAIGPCVFLMGGTLPAAARAAEGREDASRSRLAFLYGLNTCGAVVGALLGTFFLFEILGTRLSLLVGVGLNLVVGAAARRIGSRLPEIGAEEVAETKDETERPRAEVVFIYVMSALVGFAFLFVELVWYRMLGPILGGSTFTFGLILAVALAGIGLGGYLYSRRPEEQAPGFALLAGTAALEALFVVVPFALGDQIAIYAANVRSMMSVGFWPLVFGWASVALLVVFPASLIAGYQFPLLLALLGRGRANVATHVARVYAFNTGGSILGSLLGGMVLIPALGATASWRLVGAFLLLVSFASVVMVVVHDGRRVTPVSGGLLVLSALCTVPLLATGPTAAWRHEPIGAGRARLAEMDRNTLTAWRRDAERHLIWQADGLESSVGVTSKSGIAFVVNGKLDGSVAADRATQTMAGLLPALLHREPKTMFIVGLGTGMSAGWAAELPSIQRVDSAELEPAIAEVARLSAPFNFDALNHPKIHHFWGDGREYMLTVDQSYDVIVSEPSNPYRAGIAAFFTTDFYEVVRSKLNEGGIFAQWLQSYEIDGRALRTALATLTSVFPYVEAWQTQVGDLLLISSVHERRYDADSLRKRILVEPYKSALPQTWLVQDLEGVLAHLVANSSMVNRSSVLGAPPINTDDRNVLEYSFARSVGMSGKGQAGPWMEASAKLSGDRPRIRGTVDWGRVNELKTRAWMIAGGGREPMTKEPKAVRRVRAVNSACNGKLRGVAAEWRSQEQAPQDDIELYTLAVGEAFSGSKQAPKLAERLAKRGYELEANLAFGMIESRAGRPKEAVELMLRGVEAMYKSRYPICAAGHTLLSSLSKVAIYDPNVAARVARLLMKRPFPAFLHDEDRRQVAQHLAFLASRQEATLKSVCVEVMERELKHPRWEKGFLVERARCLKRAGHPMTIVAEDDLRRFQEAKRALVFPLD